MKTPNKISIKSVCGNVKKLMKDAGIKLGEEKDDGKKLDLMRIFGIARSFKIGSSDYGDWVAIEGEFKATNLIDGSSCAGSKAFFPGGVGEMIMNAIQSGDGSAIEIAFQIAAVADHTSAVDYIYESDSLTAMSEDSALARLEQTVMKRLEAPAKAKK